MARSSSMFLAWRSLATSMARSRRRAADSLAETTITPVSRATPKRIHGSMRAGADRRLPAATTLKIRTGSPGRARVVMSAVAMSMSTWTWSPRKGLRVLAKIIWESVAGPVYTAQSSFG